MQRPTFALDVHDRPFGETCRTTLRLSRRSSGNRTPAMPGDPSLVSAATVRRVKRSTMARSATLALATVVLATLAAAIGSVAADPPTEHQVNGRFSISSDAGDAVWGFQPDGLLVLIGPGALVSEGSWTTATGDREFDASVDYSGAGQVLEVQGQVSPDGSRIAVYVVATESLRPDDADPWPAESRLVGELLGMQPEVTPLPSAVPIDCSRPEWVDGGIDWDRCDELVPTEA